MAAYVATNDKTVLSRSNEDGKLSKTQSLTHADILAIGHRIFQQNDANQRDFFNEEVTQLKEAWLHKAMVEKDLALKEAEKRTAAAVEKAVNDAKSLQESIFKEEAKQISNEMEEIAAKRVEEEHKEGEERMQTALVKQRQYCEAEKCNAVRKARDEEQAEAMQVMTELIKKHEGNIARVKWEDNQMKQSALSSLEKKLTEEREKAVLEMQLSMQEKANNEKKETDKVHEQYLEKKDTEITEKEQKINNLLEEIEKERAAHTKTKDRLRFVMDSFQSFIDCQPGFTKGQAEFLLQDFVTD